MSGLFIPHFTAFYESIKSGEILTKHGETYKYGSVFTWKTALYNFIEYEKTIVSPLRIEDITDDFIMRFIAFLNEKNAAKNSIGCMLARLYAFLNHPRNRNMYNPINRINMSETIRPVYNSLDEIDRIAALDVPKNYIPVREAYVLQANLGLRYSDMLRLLHDKITNYITECPAGYLLNIKTQKTREIVTIPLRKQAFDIITRNNFKIDTRCIQYVNKHIKTIAREAGIVQDVIYTYTRGGVLTDMLFNKCDLITTHTARRSFATNALLSEIPVTSIMRITGHVTEASFYRYIGATNLQNAIKLFDYDFFK